MSDREVSGNWRKSKDGNGHQKRFEHILESGFWSDVIFTVGTKKEKVPAHKLILRTGSKAFENLFKEDMNKASFEVPDLEPALFKLLLKFLYTGESSIKVEECLPVMNAASKYEVSDLVQRCGNLLAQTLTQESASSKSNLALKWPIVLQFLYTGESSIKVEECLPVMDVASKYEVSDLVQRCGNLLAQTLTQESAIKVFQQAIKYGDQRLEEVALACICQNGYKIVESAPFLELSEVALTKILKRDELEVKNETQLFEAVVSWGKAELKRQKMIETNKYLRSVLENLIYFVRFPQMDQSDFSLKVYASKLLLDSDYIAVLMYFGVPVDNRGSAPSGPFNSKPRVAYTPRGQEFILTRLVQNSKKPVMDLATNLDTGKMYIPSTFQEHSIRFKADTSIWVKSIGMNSKYLDAKPVDHFGRVEDPFARHRQQMTLAIPFPSPITQHNKCQKCHHTLQAGSICSYCPSISISSEVISVMIQIKTIDNKLLASKNETIQSTTKTCTGKVYHVKFNKPVFIRADEWYIATFTLSSGDFCGNQFTADGRDGDFKIFKIEIFSLKDQYDRWWPGQHIKFEFKNDGNPRYTGTTQGFIPEIAFMIE